MYIRAEDMICTAIKGSTVEEMRKILYTTRSNIVELRIDTLGDYSMLEELKRLVHELHRLGKKSIITLREKREGGEYTGPSDEKFRILMELASVKPDFMDIELSFSSLSKLMDELKNTGINVILSHHDFSGTPGYNILRGLVRNGLNRGAHIVKIITLAKEPLDNIVTLSLCSEWSNKVVSFCMGRKGLVSRILAPFFGAPFTYAYPKGGDPTAPGQISVDEVIELWRKLGLI